MDSAKVEVGSDRPSVDRCAAEVVAKGGGELLFDAGLVSEHRASRSSAVAAATLATAESAGTDGWDNSRIVDRPLSAASANSIASGYPLGGAGSGTAREGLARRDLRRAVTALHAVLLE